jgi:hypothetical protein
MKEQELNCFMPELQFQEDLLEGKRTLITFNASREKTVLAVISKLTIAKLSPQKSENEKMVVVFPHQNPQSDVAYALFCEEFTHLFNAELKGNAE